MEQKSSKGDEVEVGAEEKLFDGNGFTIVKRSPDYTVYAVKNACGEGTMTRYPVFPGVDLIYNDFYVQKCFLKLQPRVAMIGIDHCCEGCRERRMQNSLYMYLHEGSPRKLKDCLACNFKLPFNHYQGITIAIYIEEAANTLAAFSSGFSLDLHSLRNKLSSCKGPFILWPEDSVQRIVAELYAVSDKIRDNYFKIKVLELLLFLTAADVGPESRVRPYFPRHQVDAVKAIRRYMTDNLDKHLTLEELSSRFGIPLTVMKTCFKGIYGSSVYAYLRSYRIRTAAKLLSQTERSVTEIARQVGYENPSKFAAAFKEMTAMSPTQYRNGRSILPGRQRP